MFGVRRLCSCLILSMLIAGGSNLFGGVLAYYDFDGSNPLSDRSGNGRDAMATEETTVTFTPGVFGVAATFPGVSIDGGSVTEDDHLTVPVELAPNFGLSDITVSLWFRRNNPQDDIGATGPTGGPDGIYDSLAGTDSGYQLFLLPAGVVNGRFDTADGGFAVLNSDEGWHLEANDQEPDTFEWHHLAYTIDRDEEIEALYIDGELADFISPAGEIVELFDANVTPSQDLWIGRANQHGADGSIDDLAFFDQALTEEEVSQLHAKTLSPADFSDSVLGDFDGDGTLSAADINLLTQNFGESNLTFDLDGNGTVEPADQRISGSADQRQWVESVFGTALGDADLNFAVEFADFLTLSGNFSKPGGWEDGDFNGNGAIEFGDFLILSGNFGLKSEAVAVPEPTTDPTSILTVLLGLLVMRKRIRP